MHNLTPSQVQQIRKAAIKAFNSQATLADRILMDMIVDECGNLARAMDKAVTLANRYEGNLANIRQNLSLTGSLGNPCGVMQGVHEIEMVNMEIETLRRVIYNLNRAIALCPELLA